jgi:hypothetical protein
MAPRTVSSSEGGDVELFMPRGCNACKNLGHRAMRFRPELLDSWPANEMPACGGGWI